FYASQRATLNITRSDMLAAGYSPSVRLFEAAACGVPILTDVWEGIERYFEPGRETILVGTADEVERGLTPMKNDEPMFIGEKARARVFRFHTAAARATPLLAYVRERLSAIPRAAE